MIETYVNKLKINETYNKYQSTIIASITTAVLLLVTLAWNDVIQTIINNYYQHKDDNTIRGKLTYAVVITIFVVLVQLYLFPYIESYK
jgi:uncharacterized membrane protein YcjF (UPF0283 family)